jgi:hypothetical protein
MLAAARPRMVEQERGGLGSGSVKDRMNVQSDKLDYLLK